MERSLLRGGDGAPGLWLAIISFVSLLVLFALSGTLAPERLPVYATSPRQIVGMALMLTGLPSYLLAVWAFGHRRALRLVDALAPELPDPGHAEAARLAIRSALRRSWRWGVFVGAILVPLNTSPIEAMRSDTRVVDLAISFGQTFLWLVIGVVLVVRVRVSLCFRRLAQQVDFDLFQLERLGPLAKNGLADVLLIAGALLFTPLQSLDAEFRWVNYQFPVLLGPLVSVFLLFWPLWPIHLRLVADRAARLATIDAELRRQKAGGADLDVESTLRLETLLAHRDRIRDARTWPVGLDLLSRALFYVVLPPLAWAGAALVEQVVDRFVAGAP